MAEKISDVMSEGLRICAPNATARDAAHEMREADIGAVLVGDNGELRGLLTDRDIVVRAVAEDRDPAEVRVDEICSSDLFTLSPEDTTDDAVDLIRQQDVRRIPIVDGGRPVGIVTIGDLAVARDEKSALADISAAAPNN
jgi:CBS domain-containing protein